MNWYGTGTGTVTYFLLGAGAQYIDEGFRNTVFSHADDFHFELRDHFTSPAFDCFLKSCFDK
jgi:hypothetical protein